jgi:Winged helix-turn-helix DNA-binding
MSVLEDLRGFESRVLGRMRELRPLVDEYRELEAVAERLGLRLDELDSAGDQSGPSRRRRRQSTRQASARSASARSAGSRRTSGGRRGAKRKLAPAGQRQEQLLALVNSQPGITVRQIGKEIGVDPTSLYRIVRALEKDGTIKKEGSALQPA